MLMISFDVQNIVIIGMRKSKSMRADTVELNNFTDFYTLFTINFAWGDSVLMYQSHVSRLMLVCLQETARNVITNNGKSLLGHIYLHAVLKVPWKFVSRVISLSLFLYNSIFSFHFQWTFNAAISCVKSLDLIVSIFE